jgi:ribonuclease BN (tRNA processing enzyme)
MKLSKLEHIFITHPSWDNIGGLPGVALTIQDVGVPGITLHGPPGTVWRYFNVAVTESARICWTSDMLNLFISITQLFMLFQFCGFMYCAIWASMFMNIYRQCH